MTLYPKQSNHVYVIAEIGINHNGSIDIAHELIDIAAKHGCDAVKFQKRKIDLVYTKDELDAPRESPWGTTFRQQKQGLEFSIEQYMGIERYAKGKGLDFIMSCWDLNSIKEVEANLNIKYHKIPSALLTDKDFLKAINETGKPAILSTGMSTPEEIYKAIRTLHNIKYILSCTSAYPTKDEEVNLGYVKTLQYQVGSKAGFSNHSNGLLACIGAVAAGAKCIEFHITKDRTMYGSDQAASIENVEDLMSGIRKMEILLGDGEKIVYDSELPIIKKLRKVNNIRDFDIANVNPDQRGKTIKILLKNETNEDKIFDLYEEYLKLEPQIESKRVHFTNIKMSNYGKKISSNYEYLNNIFSISAKEWGNTTFAQMNEHVFYWGNHSGTMEDIKNKKILVEKNNSVKFVFFLSRIDKTPL